MVRDSADLTRSGTRDPVIDRLVGRDRSEWECVFEDLYPVAREVSRALLQGRLEAEAEDVAVEALEALVGQIDRLKSADELRPLVISISRNKSRDRLKHFLAQKRNANAEVSIEAFVDAGGEWPDGGNEFSIIDHLSLQGLRELLQELAPRAKVDSWAILLDVYLCGLTEEEVARKREISSNSVRKFIQRGLDEIRNALMSNSVLREELRDLLNIERRIPECISIAFAASMSGVRDRRVDEVGSMMRASRMQRTSADVLENNVRVYKSLPETRHLDPNRKQRLMSIFGDGEANSDDRGRPKRTGVAWVIIVVCAVLITFLVLKITK